MLRQSIRRFIYSTWLPWSLLGVAIIAALILGNIQPLTAEKFPIGILAAFLGFVLLAVGAVYLVFSRFSDLAEQRAFFEARLDEADQRLDAIFQINQSFVEACDEVEVIQPALRLVAGLMKAKGAVFIPLDEHGQPQTALAHGEIPVLTLEAWAESLISTGVREACRNCDMPLGVDKPGSCPLRETNFFGSADSYCILLRRNEIEFGVISLFFSGPASLDARSQSFLHALVDEVALGLEGVRLRRRELDAFRQSQALRQRADLKVLLRGLMENMLKAMDADFAMLIANKPDSYQPKIDLVIGDLSPHSRPFIDGILQEVMASGEPTLSGDIASGQEPVPGLRSLLSAPLFSSERSVVGAVAVGNCRMKGFHQRQIALLQAISGQVALVVENADLMAELESKTMIQERARLAREIHDGLAQTIGFLKLQAAQLRTNLGRNELDRARQTADLFYATLSEAYQDARQSIDWLRISSAEAGLNGWIEQTLAVFQEVSGLVVELEGSPIRISLSPEIHAQLIRIIQEALSNVRKHAQAKRVWVMHRQMAGDLILEVRDDGEGFCPDDLSSASKYGLRGMQERAALIGATLEVISQPGQGTTIRVVLPFQSREGLVQ